MKVIFMGTPAFAIPSLDALVGAGHDVACVYTQPPRPAGRGHKESPSAVHAFASAKGLPVRTPTSLKPPEEQAAFAALEADVAVVIAYGLILPKPILDAPRLGCVNIHASLLPRWRGAAPIQRAVLAGDRRTGVTIMQMDEGLDTGPMLLRDEVKISATTTATALHDELAALGAKLIVEALGGLAKGTLTPRRQPKRGITYASKIDLAEIRLDWRRPASEVGRAVRAFAPRAWFEIEGERIRVLEAKAIGGASKAAPRTVIDDKFTIACGNGMLRPLKVQRAGKAPVDADAFLRGFPIAKGTVLSVAEALR